MDLAVVLISKNQEWNVARLIGSVLRETNRLPASEIVLVDSASTDKTAEIAASYPISVLKLAPDQRLTAAAGRYVGFQHTTGDLVLFLDGDMELCPGWLDQALAVLHDRPEVAVVCGRVIDRPLDYQAAPVEAGAPVGADSELPGTPVRGNEVRHGGGAAIYRRSVLNKVGPFNPYLYSDEEPELCIRIRHAGYRVYRLDHPIAYHYTPLAEAFNTLLDRRARNLWIGFGQILRYDFGSPLFWYYLKERGWVAGPVVALGLGIIAMLVGLLTGQWIWLAGWGAAVLLLTLALALRKHSLKRAIFSLFQRLLLLDGTVRGLLLKPLAPSSYPGRYTIIRSGASGLN